MILVESGFFLKKDRLYYIYTCSLSDHCIDIQSDERPSGGDMEAVTCTMALDLGSCLSAF